MTEEKIKIKFTAKYEKKSFFNLVGKRICDVTAAYLILILTYIPMFIIAIAVKLSTNGSVIFKQTRVGEGGRLFVCYKFRTMRTDAPQNLSTAEFKDADSYITPVGRFLRKTSLDELPQIFNVLNGDMSFVGPRPLIPHEKELHKKRAELGVYSIRPGITGLAQIRGRDMLRDEEKLRYDAEYVEQLCFLSDAKIIFSTILKVFKAENIALAQREPRNES